MSGDDKRQNKEREESLTVRWETNRRVEGEKTFSKSSWRKSGNTRAARVDLLSYSPHLTGCSSSLQSIKLNVGIK